MVAVQRTDSALRLNVHLHALVLDGVYVRDAHGVLIFHPSPMATDWRGVRRGVQEEEASPEGRLWHLRVHLFTNIGGRLPPAVIQANVRQNYGKLRLCYEEGLARKPDLQGRVTVRFVIGRTGRVDEIMAVNGEDAYPPFNLTPDPGTEAFFEPLGLELPPPKARSEYLDDPDVVACMVEHYRNMRFPEPEGGIVTVVYPIVFAPSVVYPIVFAPSTSESQ